MITTKRDFGGIEQLPEGLLLKILCRIPTEHLLKTCRYVCKAWFRLLKHELQNPSFIHSNSLFYDPSCIVFGDWPLDAYIADPTGNLVKTHAIRTHWLRRRLPMSNLNSPDHQFRGRICGSSDGVLLIMLHDVDHTFCVVNPLTMQLVTLPHVNHDQNFGVITRIPDTGKFKVLTYGEDENGSCVWYVTTVGIDMSWKILFGVPSSCNPSNAFLPWEFESVSVNEIVFVRFHVDPQDFTFAVIDLHNETGYWLEIPTYCRSGQQNGRWNGSWRLMNINNKYLGYTELKKEVNADMDVWVLKELGRNVLKD